MPIQKSKVPMGFFIVYSALIIYMLGDIVYLALNDRHSSERADLSKRKSELVSKINKWKKHDLLKESFPSLYKDSLENAAKDTNEINLRMAELEKEYQRMYDKAEDYSWLAFFMD